MNESSPTGRGVVIAAGLFLLAGWVLIGRTEEGLRPLPEREDAYFHDSFDRESVGDAWELTRDSFALREGAMIGGMNDTATHPAIAKVSQDFGDIALRFSFRLDGARAFNIVFNDIHEATAHAGHVARMSVRPHALQLTDDKLGLMNKQWVDRRRDPAFKEQIEELRRKYSRIFPFEWEAGRWYELVLQVIGDEAKVSIDGRLVGAFRSPGFAQPTKTSFHFSVSGRDLSVDDLTAWRL